MEYGRIEENEIFIETRGRKPIDRYEMLDDNVLAFIDWVEGAYNPRTQAEQQEFYLYAEKCFPHLVDTLY